MHTAHRSYRSRTSGSRSNFSRSSSSRRSGGGGYRGKSGNRNRGRRPQGRRKMPSFDPSQFINKNPAPLKEETYTPQHTFASFGLDNKLVQRIHAMNIITPTPIQDQIIPEILKGHDVVGLAETGTGKTAAFLVPLIEKTLKDYKRQTLILAPTRELALQINEELRKLSKGLRIYSVVCVGGMSIHPQIRLLKKRNHFIIGTPGRVLDLIERGDLKANEITSVVLDEADRMLDMGFIGDMRKIISATPENREGLFFSATMDGDAEKLVHDFLKNPITISVKKRDVTSSIEQDVVSFDHSTKFETLVELVKQPEFSRVLVFGTMKHSVEKLSKDLSGHNLRAVSIHGNKNHGQRQRALQSFKEGHAKIMVATDVAARGIHVNDVSHVINYDLPQTFEDYVHRIGRTGRGTKQGKALTFVAG